MPPPDPSPTARAFVGFLRRVGFAAAGAAVKEVERVGVEVATPVLERVEAGAEVALNVIRAAKAAAEERKGGR